jgi:hypothetical protein
MALGVIEQGGIFFMPASTYCDMGPRSVYTVSKINWFKIINYSEHSEMQEALLTIRALTTMSEQRKNSD